MFSGINIDRMISSNGTVLSKSTVTGSSEYIKHNRQNYDQFELSQPPQGEEKQCKELVAQISSEIRSQTTRGQLAEIKAQIQAGTYQPDPYEIAARMLLIKREDV